MSKIVSKLDLNKTPQLVENNSLIMAKNIRLLEDGTIGPDTSMGDIRRGNGIKYISQIVGFDNKVYFFLENDYIVYSHQSEDLILAAYPGEVFEGQEVKDGQRASFSVNDYGYVLRDGILFEDSGIASQIEPVYNNRVKIFEYDEKLQSFEIVPCGWKYSGGEINGCVFRNNTGDIILTVCEYNAPGKVIPIKHINLSICENGDDESIYTQNPNIAITNLLYVGEYSATIPAGVYQFFIRYKINDNHYTNWFPCSKEYFSGTKKKLATIQGELYYVDRHEDSSSSFIFNVEHLYPDNNKVYEKYQLGFIVSKDDGGIIAREWKEFDFSIETVYFDCFPSDIKEANIDDFLETSYEIFNVENCAVYKNKMYIANYEETNFNPDLESLAKQIQVEIKSQTIESAENTLYFDNELLISSQDNTHYDYVKTQSDNNHIKHKWGINPYFDISNTDLTTDDSGTFDELPKELEEHHHIENSNVLADDYNDPHLHTELTVKPYSYDDDTFEQDYTNSQYVPENGWMNSVNIKKFNYNKKCALRVYFKYNNTIIDLDTHDYTDTYQTPFNDSYIRASNTIDGLTSRFDKAIQANIAYFDTSNNVWYIKLGNNYYPISEYYILYSEVKVTRKEHVRLGDCSAFHNNSSGWFGSGDILYIPEFDVVFTQKTINLVKRQFVFDTSVITSEIEGGKVYPTLLPFTNYNFYVHYVKENGVHTNGYLINSEPICIKKYAHLLSSSTTTNNVKYHDYDNPINLQEDDDIILYPSFTNIVKPEGYVSCFITASKLSNNVCQLFNVIPDNSTQGIVKYVADCLELDTLLYTKFDNIDIYNSNGDLISNKGKYYSSGNTEDTKYLGQCGSVAWTTDTLYQTDGQANDIFWIVFKTNNSIEKLIKFTPYIKLDDTPQVYNEYDDITSLGFVCYVKKLNKDNLYISGSDVYTKQTTLSGSNSKLELVEDTNENDYMLVRNNHENRIKSNFNLNFLNLTEDISVQPKTITDSNPSKTLLIYTVNSLISSSIYILNSWYREYTRKSYAVYTDKNKVRYDNTIRCSNVIQDESYDIFKFSSTNYYNVPTIRGIITNLITIANSIYVHCEHSLYKFSDSRTLNTEEEAVILQENDVFNSGIENVFDAQYGHGGLAKRSQSLITYNAYIFYDEVTKVIYAFGGQQQLAEISNSIKKLINSINPIDVKFVADELHNRFFVNFITIDKNICLSFNFASNSFISIHDINFKVGFHTRSNTYFVHDNKNVSGNVTGWSMYKIVDFIQTPTETQGIYNYYYSAYKNCYEQSIIRIVDCDTGLTFNNVKSVNSCLDIVINIEYEKIKVLDYLSWISSKSNQYKVDTNFISEENVGCVFPGNKLRIYTDMTYTDLFDLMESDNLTPKMGHDYRNIDAYGNPSANPKSWQYPQFNCGVWSMNYFRNVKLIDLFNYKNPNNQITGGTGHSETTDLTPKPLRENLTQENSLIYGKYFVVRFIFNNVNFKLENIVLKLSDYGKTK